MWFHGCISSKENKLNWLTILKIGDTKRHTAQAPQSRVVVKYRLTSCKKPPNTMQHTAFHQAKGGLLQNKKKRTQGKERRIYSTCILTNKNIFMYFSFICQPTVQNIEHQRLTRQQATDTSFFICQPYTKYIGTINSKWKTNEKSVSLVSPSNLLAHTTLENRLTDDREKLKTKHLQKTAKRTTSHYSVSTSWATARNTAALEYS